MQSKNKLTEDLHHLENLSAKNDELMQKLDEFMLLLEHSQIDSNNIKSIQSQVNKALDQKLTNIQLINEIKEVSLDDNIGKLAQLEQLEDLLNHNFLDSRQTKSPRFTDRFSKTIQTIIGFLFITLGFAMIILPAPPYFEMFTIFYFNPDDGVTLMDLIALIIIAVGTSVVIRSMLNSKKHD